MIDSIIKFSIRNRVHVLAVTGMIFVYGLFNIPELTIDAVPDVTNVQVSVVTESPGLSPAEIEQFITFPVEMEMTGLPDVKEIRSLSRTGVSSVTIVFKDSTNIWFARQMVNERLGAAEAGIPEGYGKPILSPPSTALGDIYEFTISSKKHTQEEIRTYVDWEMAKRIKSLSGIVDVNVIGGKVKQYQILINPNRLATHNLTLSEILESLKKQNLNTGGGYLLKKKEQIVIRGEALFKSVREIENTAIKTEKDGTPLLIGQVAEVRIGSALRFGLATQHGHDEVVAATVMMLIGENSREVVSLVKKEMEKIKKQLPDGMEINVFYDRSEFIGRALNTVFVNLTEAAVLVFLILVISFGSVKGGLLVASAIPVSMAITVIIMRKFGVVGNLMSLGAIDFGLLVDGCVVLLESVLVGFARSQTILTSIQNQEEKSEIVKSIIEENCIVVAKAAVFSMAIIMLVYVPLMTLEDVEGKMFIPMAFTVASALAVAMIFTLTTFPAALTFLYANPKFYEPAYWKQIESFYSSLLELIRKKHSGLFMRMTLFFAISAFILSIRIGSEFLPKIDEGEIDIDIRRLPSASLDYSKTLNQEIENLLMEIPEVKSAVSKMGRGESAAEPVGTDEGSVMVKFIPKKEWKTAKTREEMYSVIKQRIEDRIPSSFISISQPIENRVNSLLAGSKADVVLKIYGENLQELKTLADNYAEKLKNIQGTGDLRVQRILGLPILEIKADKIKTGRYGVISSEIMDTVETLRVGAKAGKVFEGLKQFDLRVKMNINPDELNQLENIPVMTSTGKTVPIGVVADINKVEGPALITREGLKRRIFVEVNLRGRDLVGYIQDARKATQELTDRLPSGYYAVWGGQFENFSRAKNRLMMMVPIALAIIFGLLLAAFNSFSYAVLVFSVVPIAVAGGIYSLIATNLNFSIPAGVGFIAICGISVLNGIVFANGIKKEATSGKSLDESILLASIHGIRPILTTSVISIAGFIPMALSSGTGSEVQNPLAIVVIGGMLFATIISVFMLPILASKLLKGVILDKIQ